jgi:hypothetical protein
MVTAALGQKIIVFNKIRETRNEKLETFDQKEMTLDSRPIFLRIPCPSAASAGRGQQ